MDAIDRLIFLPLKKHLGILRTREATSLAICRWFSTTTLLCSTCEGGRGAGGGQFGSADKPI